MAGGSKRTTPVWKEFFKRLIGSHLFFFFKSLVEALFFVFSSRLFDFFLKKYIAANKKINSY